MRQRRYPPGLLKTGAALRQAVLDSRGIWVAHATVHRIVRSAELAKNLRSQKKLLISRHPQNFSFSPRRPREAELQLQRASKPRRSLLALLPGGWLALAAAVRETHKRAKTETRTGVKFVERFPYEDRLSGMGEDLRQLPTRLRTDIYRNFVRFDNRQNRPLFYICPNSCGGKRHENPTVLTLLGCSC